MPQIRNCALSYKNMTDKDKKISFVLFHGGKTNEYEIVFSPLEFKHLSGLHKFEKHIKQASDNSFKLLRNACKPNGFPTSLVLNSGKIFNDTGKTEEEKMQLRQSLNGKILQSDFLSRLHSLETLDAQLSSVEKGIASLKIYQWDKKAVKREERPNYSDIKADMLFEFYNPSLPKPYTCFFLVRNNDKEPFVGESIFASSHSYSTDNEYFYQKRIDNNYPRKTVREYEILSVTLSDNTSQETILMQCSPDRYKACKEIDAQTKYEQKIKPLKDARSKYLKAEKQGDIYNQNEARYNYTNFFIDCAINNNLYSQELLNELKEELKKELDSPSLPSDTKRHCIGFEYDMVNLAILSRELLESREAKAKGKDNDYENKALEFGIKAVEGYEDYTIAVLQKQKKLYDTKAKQKLFSEKEISEIKEMIDSEIDMINGGRGQKPREKPRDDKNNKKNISPLTEKPSKIQAIIQTSYNKLSNLKQYISDSISELKEYIGSIKEQFPEFINSAKQVLHTVADNIRFPIRFPNEEETDNKNIPKIFSFDSKDCTDTYDNVFFATTAQTYVIELNGTVSSGIYEYSFPFTKLTERKSEVVKPVAEKNTEQPKSSLIKKDFPQNKEKSVADKPKKKKSQFEYGD